MKAMIMAAGVGSRLMPLTMDVPKPMIYMGNRPLMENIVQVIDTAGITECIANLHYYGQQITDHFNTVNNCGVHMHFSPEKELMGTAGGVKRCQWFLNDTFVVMSGDGLTDIDLNYLIAEHKRHGALASIAVKPVAEVEQYGVVVTDDQDKIAAFQEKPRRSEAISNLANTGIYIFEPEIFDYIPGGQFYDFGKQVFPALVKAGAPFYAIPVDCYWCDVGSLETYLQAHYDILEGFCRYEVLGDKLQRYSDGSRFLIGADCSIDGLAYISGRTTLGERCRLESQSVVNDSVIWSDTIVEKQAIINCAVIGSNCLIGAGSYIEPGVVVASGCSISPGARLLAGTRVFRQGDEQVVTVAG